MPEQVVGITQKRWPGSDSFAGQLRSVQTGLRVRHDMHDAAVRHINVAAVLECPETFCVGKR
jgi:hypothetical protein